MSTSGFRPGGKLLISCSTHLHDQLAEKNSRQDGYSEMNSRRPAAYDNGSSYTLFTDSLCLMQGLIALQTASLDLYQNWSIFHRPLKMAD